MFTEFNEFSESNEFGESYLRKNLIDIGRRLCSGRQPIVNRVVARKATDWSKFCKGVKQGIQLACIWCPNAQAKLLMNVY